MLIGTNRIGSGMGAGLADAVEISKLTNGCPLAGFFKTGAIRRTLPHLRSVSFYLPGLDPVAAARRCRGGLPAYKRTARTAGAGRLPGRGAGACPASASGVGRPLCWPGFRWPSPAPTWSAWSWPQGGAGLHQLGALAVCASAILSALAPAGPVQVLLVQRDAEARIEGALDHALAVHFQECARRQSRPIRGARTWPGRRRPWERTPALAHGRDVQGHDDLVGHLAGLAVRRCRR